MKVNWAWLSRMSTKWKSGTARDWPEEEQSAYRASLGLPQTPRFQRQPANTNALDTATRKWFGR